LTKKWLAIPAAAAFVAAGMISNSGSSSTPSGDAQASAGAPAYTYSPPPTPTPSALPPAAPGATAGVALKLPHLHVPHVGNGIHPLYWRLPGRRRRLFR
jgi:hypothetical protein